MDELNQLRSDINEIDAGILDLLDRRMKLALKISKTKKSIGKEIYDAEREEELFAALMERNKETILPDEKVLEIWGKIIELSRNMQS